jgi:hypothetical protein
MRGYVIKSVSEEGIYYLCNGWSKHKAFWVEYRKIDKAIFKTIGQAKSSLTKLLKVMDDYRNDYFSICELHDNYDIVVREKI